MSRIAYVNGRYLPHSAAHVHIEDRGYQFSDGVYEVCEIHDGLLVDEKRHMARLKRSLSELRIRTPMSAAALGHVMRETIRRNRIRNGLVYLQITRGVARRDHAFPAESVVPAVVVTAKAIDPGKSARQAEQGIAVITVPDNRWDRVDIKTISLLPNVLARQAAADAGAGEAWFVDAEGKVTEGSSTNTWIVDRDGRMITRPAEFGILRGVTRSVIVDLAKREGLELVERAFTVEEAEQAREAFLTSATKLVTPVVKINDRVIGNGRPGSIATRLRQLFYSQAELAE